MPSTSPCIHPFLAGEGQWTRAGSIIMENHQQVPSRGQSAFFFEEASGSLCQELKILHGEYG